MPELRRCGMAALRHPVNGHLDDGWTIEVLQSTGDGTPDCHKFLYGGAAGILKASGYRHLVTYAFPREFRTSVRAAGWTSVAEIDRRC